ncbi:MAG: 50S ribosomal protein L11 methyltransferase [Myxococcota bacterium]|nr:50S ribosomal protein L11 methyltransferase [Myxococcota bacterium]
MSWIELQLVVPRRSIERVGAALFELGAMGLQEDFLPGQAPAPRQPWDDGPPPALPDRALLKAWWEAERSADLDAAVSRVAAGIEGAGQPRWFAVEDTGWSDNWRAQCERVVVDDALAVAPPWKARKGDLIIEPGMAFGTGDHPTTLSCLRGIRRHAVAGERCLDVGTGSGVLAIAATQAGMTAWGIDIEEESVKAAHSNAALNGVSIRADQTPLAAVAGPFELVVANLFAEVLVALSDDLKRVCSRRLVVAGVLADRADAVVDAMRPMVVERRDVEGDWCHLGFCW